MTTTWTVPATVIDVIDGDTLRLLLDLGWRITYTARARVAGIDAPELGTEDGNAARAYAVTLAPPGSAVTLHSHSIDMYGRPLGTVLLPDGQDFGDAMLAAGYAVPYHR